MTDLIQKLETAEAGSRELSAEVLLACGWNNNTATGVAFWTSPDGRHPMHPPSPTESVDDALGLVPKGALPRKMAQHSNGWTAALWTIKSLDFQEVAHASGATLALALCTALLRAQNKE